MPMFFFNVTLDEETTIDHEGHELSSAEQAHKEAVRAITELSMDTATTTSAHVVSVAISNAEHHVICTASVIFDPGELETYSISP